MFRPYRPYGEGHRKSDGSFEYQENRHFVYIILFDVND